MKCLNKKGNVAVILCLIITGILGFSALAVDVGLIYIEKANLTNAIDAAALAAVLELPNNPQGAIAVARDYLSKNNINPDHTLITVEQNNKAINIKGKGNAKHFFAPIIGITESDVASITRAVIAPAKSVKGGIRPFAVEVFDFSYGDIVTLKEGAGDGYRGNYKAIALGGTGASIFRQNALYGYTGVVSVGDFIKTETGNMAGATSAIQSYIRSENSRFDNFPRDSIRLWTIPLVDTLEVNGRGEIKVMGFGQFYVEDVGTRSGKIELTGRFVRYVINATVDVNMRDTGTYGARLSK